MPYIISIILLVVVIYLSFKPPKTSRRVAKWSKDVGDYGELLVKSEIGFTVEKEQYVINDYILANGDKSCQIDHIVINPRGVFVIETKNYGGAIYGSESQQEWTQVLAGGNVTNKFYNPIKQNSTHVYNVIKIVGNIPVHSLIVFVRDNAILVESEQVIPLSKLNLALQQGNVVLSVSQMEQAYAKLLINRSYISTEQHVENIKLQQLKLEQGICPRCGGNLVLRKGNSGEFWGCSNFPKCKFTKQKED